MKKNVHNLYSHISLLFKSNDWYVEKIKEHGTSPFQEEIFCVAVILNAWSALEGFINHLASIAKFAGKLAPHEKAFLEEKNLELGDSGEFKELIRHHSTTKKYLFLLNRFSSVRVSSFKSSKLWSDMKRAEKMRDTLVHTKEGIDDSSVSFTNTKLVDNTSRLAVKYLEKHLLKNKRSVTG